MHSINLRIDDHALSSLICSALQGIRYWAVVRRDVASGYEIAEHDESTKPGWHALDSELVLIGLQVCFKRYPKVFAQWASGQGDMTTADIVVQCGLFGEAVYG